MFLWWPHTRTHNSVSRASWRSSRGERDRARSNWIGLRETRLIFIFLIVCLCYSGILNPRFSAFWGLSFCFLFFCCWTSCLSFGSENWTGTWTGPDRLVNERKVGTGDKLVTSLSVRTHATTGASSATMKASTLILFFSVFTPSTKQLDAKNSHLCHRCHWGELDSSIYMHPIHFIDPSVTYSWTYISSVNRRFVALLWICQCQILSLGTEVFRPWLFECVFILLSPQWMRWAHVHIMCQLFFLSVSPATQDDISMARSVQFEWGIQLTTSVFLFFLSYIYSTKDVFILCIWRVLFQIETDWNTDTFLHTTVGMKITSTILY